MNFLQAGPGPGPHAQQPLHLGTHDHFTQQQASGAPYPPFPQSDAAIDPNLESHGPQNTTNSVPHQYHGGAGSLSSARPSTPSQTFASPRFSGGSPNQQRQSTPFFTPTDRSLPSRDVSDDTLDAAYAAFILYCNNSFPLSTDTSELIKAFRNPPKSDGKNYSTWTLFNLIQEFDRKEIKTWAELAQRLGVLPPDLEKGQSTQKVQQYSVRLKRWMRALHIDAFFEYLMNKPHAYYEEVPPLHAPFPEDGRDGVPLEEDLAIRALDPKYRPKRGRRKADEEDGAAEATSTPSKRPHLDTPTAFLNQSHPMSAYPSSAYPSSAHPDHGMRDPWAAVDTVAGANSNSDSRRALVSQSAHPSSAGQQLHWRLNNSFTPSTPQPFSAIIPGPRQTAHTAFDEPRSAISPSSSRAKRRRHGPAVSSAWSGGSNTSGGKPRGRPPSNRSMQDGPFGTFPANPASREGSMQAIPRSTPDPPPSRERAQSESGMEQPTQHFRLPPNSFPASAIATVPPQSFPVPPSRRGRLSLQVPQHVGGPVHLVTPTLLVNGESDPAGPLALAPSVFSSSSRRSSSHVPEDSDAGGSDTFPIPQARQAQSGQHSQSEVRRPDREDVKRALTADLLRARITGRKRLRGAEAKALADALLRRMKPEGGSSSQDEMSKDVFPSVSANWLGLSLTGNGCSAPNGGSAKEIVVQRFRVGKDGYDSPIYDDEEESETPAVVKETFDISWSATLGGVMGKFQIQGLIISKEDGETSGDIQAEGEVVNGNNGASDESVDWKKKFMSLQDMLREKDQEVQSLRDRVLDAVL